MHCERVRKMKRGASWIKKFRRCENEAVGPFKIPGKEGTSWLCNRCEVKTGAIAVPLEAIQPMNISPPARRGKKGKRR